MESPLKDAFESFPRLFYLYAFLPAVVTATLALGFFAVALAMMMA